MQRDPLQIALKEISEARYLLESLITSSESFDYVTAKSVLAELDKKVRTLGKAQADLAQQSGLPDESRIVPFPGMVQQPFHGLR